MVIASRKRELKTKTSSHLQLFLKVFSHLVKNAVEENILSRCAGVDESNPKCYPGAELSHYIEVAAKTDVGASNYPSATSKQNNNKSSTGSMTSLIEWVSNLKMSNFKG